MRDEFTSRVTSVAVVVAALSTLGAVIYLSVRGLEGERVPGRSRRAHRRRPAALAAHVGTHRPVGIRSGNPPGAQRYRPGAIGRHGSAHLNGGSACYAPRHPGAMSVPSRP